VHRTYVERRNKPFEISDGACFDLFAVFAVYPLDHRDRLFQAVIRARELYVLPGGWMAGFPKACDPRPYGSAARVRDDSLHAVQHEGSLPLFGMPDGKKRTVPAYLLFDHKVGHYVKWKSDAVFAQITKQRVNYGDVSFVVVSAKPENRISFCPGRHKIRNAGSYGIYMRVQINGVLTAGAFPYRFYIEMPFVSFMRIGSAAPTGIFHKRIVHEPFGGFNIGYLFELEKAIFAGFKLIAGNRGDRGKFKEEIFYEVVHFLEFFSWIR
jgi:hypothetical protein